MAQPRSVPAARPLGAMPVTNPTASSRVYGDGRALSQRWFSGSWHARYTASMSSFRMGRRSRRSVRTVSVVRSTSVRSRAMPHRAGTRAAAASGYPGAGSVVSRRILPSDVAEDPVDGDLDDHPRRVGARLAVALGVAALGLGDRLVLVADHRTALEGQPPSPLDLADRHPRLPLTHVP